MPLWVSLALAVRICVPETDEGREARLTVGGVVSSTVTALAPRLPYSRPHLGNGCEVVLAV